MSPSPDVSRRLSARLCSLLCHWGGVDRPQRRVLALLLALLMPALTAVGQIPSPSADTVAVPRPDTTTGPPSASDASDGLSAPIEFQASDSLVITFDEEEGDAGALYGQAKVTYQKATLEAHQIDMQFEKQELQASGLPADTGMVGRPRFQQQGSSGGAFRGEQLAYNLRTERGRVVGARTSIQDGLIQGDVVKVLEDSTFFISEGTYTTCECEGAPSYSLRAEKMKLQNKWLYTGPIQLYIFNIPTPLWLPFGFLPAIEGRRSGPLPPRYGEDDIGFYLRDWGWYWAINDYMDLQLQFDTWTNGSFGVSPLFRYDKRYNYNGQFQFDYVRLRRGEADDPDFGVQHTGRLRWNHNQTISPYSSLNADVNLQANSYLRNISEDYDDRVRQTVRSSVNYSKRWTNVGRSLRLNLSQRQVLTTGEVSLQLPRLSFSQSRRTPFKSDRLPAGGDERWYEKITYQYSGSLTNDYDFPAREERLRNSADSAAVANTSWYEALFSPSAYRRATGQTVPFNFEASHRIPVSANFTVNRIPVLNRRVFLTLTPNFNYTEDWFLDRRRISVADSTRQTERVPDFFALRQFSSGVSADTRFFGLFPFRIGPFDGFRHTVRPSLSYTFQPDFYDPSWGYTDTYTDLQGRTQRYALVDGVHRQRQQTLSLRVSNVFESKYVSTDTTGETQRSSLRLLNLSLNTNYNVAADSFRLGDVRMNARTRIMDEVGISMNAAFSPYLWDEERAGQIDRYVWENYQVPRLNFFNLSATTEIRSDRTGSQRSSTGSARARFGERLPGRSPYDDLNNPYGSPDRIGTVGYSDFSIPWSVGLDFNYTARRSRQTNTLTHSATINSRFDFNLTPTWKVAGRTGYDFERWEFVTTQLNIMHDFDCWEMSFRWIPFGRSQSYGFTLQVKSGKLRDLLRISHPRSDVRGRFQGLLN